MRVVYISRFNLASWWRASFLIRSCSCSLRLFSLILSTSRSQFSFFFFSSSKFFWYFSRSLRFLPAMTLQACVCVAMRPRRDEGLDHLGLLLGQLADLEGLALEVAVMHHL